MEGSSEFADQEAPGPSRSSGPPPEQDIKDTGISAHDQQVASSAQLPVFSDPVSILVGAN